MTLPRLCRGWLRLVAGLCACGLAPALLAQADADLRRALDRFSGEWTGEVQVRALDGFVLKSVPATRRYSWEADVQIVETTLRDPAGDYTVVVRQAVRLGRLEATATRPSLPDDRYVGEVASGGVLAWTDAEGNRREAREQIVERDDGSVLETTSVEPVRGFGLSGVVRMVGRFQRVPAQVAGEADGVGTPELEAARRALEASEAAQAALAARVDDLVREREAAAARIKTLETDLDTARAATRHSSAASADIEARIVTVEREAAQLRDKQGTSAQRIAALEAELAAARAAREVAATDLAAAQAAAAEAAVSSRQALSVVNARVVDLEARLDESTRRIAGLEDQLSDAERARVEALGARDDALARANEAARQVEAGGEAGRAAAAAAAAIGERLVRELAEAQRARDDALTAGQEKDARLLALQARLDGIERDARRGDDERSAQSRQLQLDNEALARAVEALQTAAAAREGELASQREALAALRQETQTQEAARAALHTALADAEAARESAVLEVASLRAQLAGGSDAVARERAAGREALDRLEKRGQEEQAKIVALERELQAAREALAARDDETAGLRADLASARSAVEADSTGRRQAEARVVEAESAAAALRERILLLETDLTQRQRDNERLAAAGRELAQERDDLRAQVGVLEGRIAADARAGDAPPAAIVPEEGPSLAASVRDRLIAEVQQMERRVLELESERNAAREQAALLQRQADEARHLRDDTLVRFQGVVAELNALREEKERLARANLSLQAELRGAQQAGRDTGTGAAAPARAGGVTPATTADGRTADIVVASLQILGVTRGDDGDKAILNGRLFRAGDTVEPELGIVFERIEEGALVFRDRRGREYRRRF